MRILQFGRFDFAESKGGVQFYADSLAHQMQEKIETLLNQSAERETELEKRSADLEAIRADVNLRDSELRQRQEEIAQTRSELAETRAERDRAVAGGEEMRLAHERLQRDLTLNEASLAQRDADLEIANEELARSESDLRQRQDALDKTLCSIAFAPEFSCGFGVICIFYSLQGSL